MEYLAICITYLTFVAVMDETEICLLFIRQLGICLISYTDLKRFLNNY